MRSRSVITLRGVAELAFALTVVFEQHSPKQIWESAWYRLSQRFLRILGAFQ